MRKLNFLLAFLLFTSVIMAQQQSPFLRNGIVPKANIHPPVAGNHQTPKYGGGTVLLDFEGITGFFSPVGDYYNGIGGPNYGVSFSPATIAANEAIGAFVNEPSATSIIGNITGPNILMNVAGGFNTSLSFYYATHEATCLVNIFDGPDGSGNLLATYTGANNNSGTCGGYAVCTWTPVTIPFAGTARSVIFTCTVGNLAVDDISFHPAGGQAAVPTLGEWGLILLGGILLMSGSAYIMRKRTSVTAC